jgi:hypothetical protein
VQSDQRVAKEKVGRRETYQKELEARLDRLTARLDALRAKADQAQLEVRAEYYEQVKALQVKKREAESKSRALRGTAAG